jgi:hypothetical protein
MSVFVQPIYTQTVGAGGAATIAFNNIPQGFTDLKLVMSVRGSNALANAYGIIGMNGAVSNSGTYMVFNGSVSSGAFTSFFYYTPSEQTANTFGVTEVYIPNYTGGNYKQLIIDSASEANSTAGYMNLQSVSTSFTGPITSLTLSGNGGTFLQHSTFTLYGVSSLSHQPQMTEQTATWSLQTPAAPQLMAHSALSLHQQRLTLRTHIKCRV